MHLWRKCFLTITVFFGLLTAFLFLGVNNNNTRLKIEQRKVDREVGVEFQHGGATNALEIDNKQITSSKVHKRRSTMSIEADGSEEENVLERKYADKVKDVFFAVKTTGKFHRDRLSLLTQTWISLVPHQVYVFTDKNDPGIDLPDGHVINTNCSDSHYRKALSCKFGFEFDHYIESHKRWLCHADDDTYVNIPELVTMLEHYDPHDDWYIGRPSLSHPIEIILPDVSRRLAFWFATGGAGFCISRSLALKMMSFAAGGRFTATADYIRLPDDCTVGYIICNQLQKKLTTLPTFHSHLESLWRIRDPRGQITLSYDLKAKNTIQIEGFNSTFDPTRLLSAHCILFPKVEYCQKYLY